MNKLTLVITDAEFAAMKQSMRGMRLHKAIHGIWIIKKVIKALDSGESEVLLQTVEEENNDI
jgi:hypothetical protein